MQLTFKSKNQLLKVVFEDLQSGNYLRDKKKKKTKDTSSQSKYTK